MRKIEPQAIWGHERPGLFHMLTQNLSQRRVQEVRSRMVLADLFPAGRINVEL